MDLQTKQCNDGCQEILPIAEFRMTLKKGLRSSCKKCERAKAKLRYDFKKSTEKQREYNRVDEELQKMEMPLKNGKIDRSGDNYGPQKCARCKKVRLSTHFRKNSQGKWKSHCNVCERSTSREYASNKYYG